MSYRTDELLHGCATGRVSRQLPNRVGRFKLQFMGFIQTRLPRANARLVLVVLVVLGLVVGFAPVSAQSPGGTQLSQRMITVTGGVTSPQNGGVSVTHTFEVGRYEVTNAEFVAFLNDPASGVSSDGMFGTYRAINVSREESQIRHNGSAFFVVNGPDAAGNPTDFSNHPVVGVTWYGAAAYTNWLSRMAGLQPVYPRNLDAHHSEFFRDDQVGAVAGYRLGLPSEWMYAARGGASGRPTAFSGSDNALQVGWFAENSENASGVARLHRSNVRAPWFGTSAVGGKAANELGIHDMSGNVQEFLHDRSMRGGSYSSGAALVRLDAFSNAHASHEDTITGFRLFRTAVGNPRAVILPGGAGASAGVGGGGASARPTPPPPATPPQPPVTPTGGGQYRFEFIPFSGADLLRAAARGADRFIIAGNGAIPYSSFDGRSWSAGAKLPMMHVTSLTYANSLYVATGDWGVLATSPDGLNWTTRPIDTGNHLSWSAYTGSRFVVTGQGGVLLTSPDGFAWTRINSGISSHLMSVAHAGNTTVAVSIDGQTLVSRDGGATWQRGSIAEFGSGTIHAVGGGPHGFVVPTSSPDGRFFHSTDGLNWTLVHRGDGRTGFGEVQWDGANYVVPGLNVIWISPDGRSWNALTPPVNGPFGRSVAGSGLLIIAGSDGAGVLVSPIPGTGAAAGATTTPPRVAPTPAPVPAVKPAAGRR